MSYAIASKSNASAADWRWWHDRRAERSEARCNSEPVARRLPVLKIAAAPFLNTRPLIQDLNVEFCSPAEGARRLAESLVDIALLPVAAFARQGDLVAAPGVCIGARNQVASVLLVADRPMEELDTIALDSSSRTSVALLRILLAAKGLHPKLEVRQSPTENALIIGDAALRAQGKHVYDLAGEWRKLTGLPFVFAVW